MSLVVKLDAAHREQLVQIRQWTGMVSVEAVVEWLIRAEIDRMQRIEKQAAQAKSEAKT